MVTPVATALCLAMQCGDFYEAIGIDAVLLVQFAGLNPMGRRQPPQAGCPKQNIRRVLADLVDNAALSVVRSLFVAILTSSTCSAMTTEAAAAASLEPNFGAMLPHPVRATVQTALLHLGQRAPELWVWQPANA